MVISQLKSALVIKGAEVMLSKNKYLADLRGINPFDLVEHQWGNYKGICERPIPGEWCFRSTGEQDKENKITGWLIYYPKQPITIDKIDAVSGESLAWQVTTEFVDRNGNGKPDPDERITGLKLVPRGY